MPAPCFTLLQVLPTQLVPDTEGKILRVRMIMKEGSKLMDPAYLFDEGSTISWIPCGRKLTCSFPGELGSNTALCLLQPRATNPAAHHTSCMHRHMAQRIGAAHSSHLHARACFHLHMQL